MQQNQREFLVEIEELVEQIFTDLDELREKRADGRSRRELIDRIFRRVHSVKGSAASSGLEAVSHIAHEFENLLAAVRAEQVPLDNEVLDTCESTTDALAESLSLAASGIVEPSRRALFDRLQAAMAGKRRAPSSDAEAILKNVPFEIWQSLNDSEKQRLISIVVEGSPLFVVATSFDMASFDEQFFQLKERLAEAGEVISTSPTLDDQHPDRINFRVLYASQTNTSNLEAAVSDFSAVVFTEISPAVEGKARDKSDETPPVPVSSLSNFVRTDLERLDQLISSTHELFRTTANALDLALSQKQVTKRARAELRNFDETIRKSFRGVEDGLIRLRMVPIAPSLQRAARAGRAAARLAGKEIDFEIVGGELRLDKALVEAIADPLIHLVRNAVDHGIEANEERLLLGKKACGRVRIEALSEGSQSRIRVIDDGRGIDAHVISEAARRLGVQAGDSPLDFDRSLRLIFRPGFTTLTTVSDVSGRGVGLDVVETAVEQAGGEVRVSSKPAEGTTFEIRLPVTFGLLRAKIFVSSDNRYCIPASQCVAVEPIKAIKPKKTAKDKKGKLKRSSSDQWPLVSMRELLGQSPAKKDSRKQAQVITCEFSVEQSATKAHGVKRIGIIVDSIEGTEEVLVRNLGRHAGRWYGVAGATELHDGTVALVLDLPRLLNNMELDL